MPDQSTALANFVALLPEAVRPLLFTAAMGGPLDTAEVERAMEGFEWGANRRAVEELLEALLPVEELVPEVYRNWRPVVRDGFAFIGARLSPERLVPKLLEQIALPEATPAEDRVAQFIRRIPSLQKIGQTIARDSNLDAGLRTRLAELEDGIREVDEPEIVAEIERQLARTLARYEVSLEPGIYAEGSVSALVRFRCAAPDAPPGVFKVLKPFIAKYFQEDLALLSALADYFDANQGRYELGHLNLRAILDDVRGLYERETDFVNERASMAAAARRYQDVSGLRVPTPMPWLSTDTITAMTLEPSVKVTDALPADPQTARKLIELLVAVPLFSADASSPFHADPHAGNLRIDPSTGDLVLLDWALTGNLSIEDRRNLILLYVTLPLRDEGQLVEVLSRLSQSDGAAALEFIRRDVESFMDRLPLGSVPGPDGIGNLVERLLKAGARFSSAFLVFRKMLTTLEDVAVQLSPGITLGGVVGDYALRSGLRNAFCKQMPVREFNVPLQTPDLLRLGLSAQSFPLRVWAQSLRSVARNLATRRKAEGVEPS
jgi:ubiquinone biosynthesis protein